MQCQESIWLSSPIWKRSICHQNHPKTNSPFNLPFIHRNQPILIPESCFLQIVLIDFSVSSNAASRQSRNHSSQFVISKLPFVFSPASHNTPYAACVFRQTYYKNGVAFHLHELKQISDRSGYTSIPIIKGWIVTNHKWAIAAFRTGSIFWLPFTHSKTVSSGKEHDPNQEPDNVFSLFP